MRGACAARPHAAPRCLPARCMPPAHATALRCGCGRCGRGLAAAATLHTCAAPLPTLTTPPPNLFVATGRARHHSGGGPCHHRLRSVCGRGRHDDLEPPEAWHAFRPGAVHRNLQRPGPGRLHHPDLPVSAAARGGTRRHAPPPPHPLCCLRGAASYLHVPYVSLLSQFTRCCTFRTHDP